VCSFASGSSGNCYLVRSSRSAILIDAGISNKKIADCLKIAGVKRNDIDGVFITHEHTDHVKGLRVLTKNNPEWKVYATEGTGLCIREAVYKDDQLICFKAGSEMKAGDITVKSFRISHDAADPVCFSVESDGRRLTVLTDTGFVCREAAEYLYQSDIVILEANHEVNMLRAGPYPYNLKRRILGEKGHLSNVDAGEALAAVMRRDSRFRHIFLAHLSSKNNFPGLALQTVKNILEESSYYMDRDYRLEVIKRDGISGMAELK
jgi:phosphoribosyl 1,2-cyclic phosphodiesterase